eukprot:SAG11_NODE_1038_length_6076_cov_4.857454_3_plen_77_part_00
MTRHEHVLNDDNGVCAAGADELKATGGGAAVLKPYDQPRCAAERRRLRLRLYTRLRHAGRHWYAPIVLLLLHRRCC